MGFVFNWLAAKSIKRAGDERIAPHRGSGDLDVRRNLLVIGGPNPLGREMRQRVILQRTEAAAAANIPGILLCGDPDLYDELLALREEAALDQLVFLGYDVPYDPLAGARSAADAGQIIAELRIACTERYAGQPGMQSAEKVCKLLLEMLEDSFGASYLTFSNLEQMVQQMLDKKDIVSFVRWFAADGGTVTDSVMKGLNQEWGDGYAYLQLFWDPIARVLAPLRGNGAEGGESIETMMQQGCTVVCMLSPISSALTLAAIGAELENQYQAGYGFNLMAYEVRLPERFAPLFAPIGNAAADFALCYTSFSAMGLSPQTPMQLTDAVCCLGTVNALDAQQLIDLCSSSSVRFMPAVPGMGRKGGLGLAPALLPHLTPNQLFAGTAGLRRDNGIPDGAACIMENGGIRFHTRLNIG